MPLNFTQRIGGYLFYQSVIVGAKRNFYRYVFFSYALTVIGINSGPHLGFKAL